MASLVYNKGKTEILSGGINLNNDTIKVMLVTSAYTPDKDAHLWFTSLSDEVSGSAGYTTSGSVLVSKTFGQDNTGDKGSFDAADVTWTTSTITARAAVIYKALGTPAISPLIAYIDFGSNKSSEAGNFTIQWNASGILTLGE